MTKAAKTLEEFDRMFDDGELDVTDYMDASTLHRPNEGGGQKALSLSLPLWLVGDLDAEASRRGVSRQAVVKTWLVDRADAERERRARVGAR